MPLYEYLCAQCGRFELIRKFSDEPLRACPTCGKDVQKLLSSPAIQFKGSGWYITDYARKGNGGGDGAGSGKTGGTDAGSTSDAKSESSSKAESSSKSDSTPTSSPSK